MNNNLSELTRHQRLVEWQWRHNSSGFDLVRIFLGGALLVRGIWFAFEPSAVAELGDGRTMEWVSYYVMIAHIGGGILLLIGLFTRLAAAVQLPILIDAVFFLHLADGFATPNQSLELSILVMLLLAIILIFGPGKYSLDYRRLRPEATPDPGVAT